MGKRIYKFISLVAAKLVGRRHDRDVDPPGVKELKNAFVSKSDAAITCRPDFNPIDENLLAVSDAIQFDGVDDNEDDYLNSATGIYGTDDLIWLSSVAPVSFGGSTSAIACSKYATGTVSISTSSTTLVGTGTEWVQNVWPGCFVDVDDSGIYYRIAEVNGDGEIVLTKAFQEATETGADYNIYRPHQFNHSNYKLNIQSFTSGIIYSCPTITMPVNAKDICGPFYAAVVETSTDKVWVEFEDDTDMGIDDSIEDNPSLCATSGTAWMCLVGVDSSEDPVIAYSTSPATEWSLITPPSNFDIFGTIIYSSGYFFITGRNTSTSKMSVAYTTDGSSWTVKDHPSIDSTARHIATNGSTIVVNSSATLPVNFYYSTDLFTTWNEVSVDAGLWGVRCLKYAGGKFITVLSTGSSCVAHYSSNGSSWSQVGGTGVGLGAVYYDVSYSVTGSFWLFVGATAYYVNKNMLKVTDLSTSTSFSYLDWASGDFTFAVWAEDKFLLTGTGSEIYSSSDLITFELEFDASDGDVISGGYSIVTKEAVFTIQPPSAAPVFAVSNQTQTTTSWNPAVFDPLSDEYRSLSHSVLDGYVVLFGTREYQSTSNSWEYYPRRIRWSTPLTYNDFSSTGSGTADLVGSGSLLDSRTVNGRIVVFESSAIGALSPRGYATDPWEYDIIKQNIRTISNPVVVDDLCYFIDDSGLLRATNGITVESPPFSFDLTEYDDFNSDSPVWLTYSAELESLCIYNPSDTNRYIYFVETESGAVTRSQAPALDLGGATPPTTNEAPKSVVCVENSSDRRMMVSYNPDGSGETGSVATRLLVAELSTGETITGKDEWTAVSAADTYHGVDVQTGNIYIVPEGVKTGIKHIIANTYTDGTSESTNPILVVQCKSLEDSDWHDNGDSNGTITVTTSACTGSGTAWSNAIGAAGGTVYTTPCLATQARIYVGSSAKTLGTDYTITGTKQITLGSAAGDTVYAYWENEPQVIARVGDYIQSTEGWHRITAISSATSMTLDHYLTSGTDATATHHHGTPLPVGEGEVKIGISKLVEGVKLRFLIFHRADGDATVTKITGVSVGHIPAGEKIVEP